MLRDLVAGQGCSVSRPWSRNNPIFSASCPGARHYAQGVDSGRAARGRFSPGRDDHPHQSVIMQLAHIANCLFSWPSCFMVATAPCTGPGVERRTVRCGGSLQRRILPIVAPMLKDARERVHCTSRQPRSEVAAHGCKMLASCLGAP